MPLLTFGAADILFDPAGSVLGGAFTVLLGSIAELGSLTLTALGLFVSLVLYGCDVALRRIDGGMPLLSFGSVDILFKSAVIGNGGALGKEVVASLG